MADLLDKYARMHKITLRSARINHQLSLESVADILNVTVETIQEYERDSRQIPCDDALKLFKLYGLSSVNVYIGVADI